MCGAGSMARVAWVALLGGFAPSGAVAEKARTLALPAAEPAGSGTRIEARGLEGPAPGRAKENGPASAGPWKRHVERLAYFLAALPPRSASRTCSCRLRGIGRYSRNSIVALARPWDMPRRLVV